MIKKIFSIALTMFICTVVSSQKIEMKSDLVVWDKEYKLKDSGTRIDYIGTVDEEQIFAHSYYPIGNFMIRFNKIGLIKTKDGSVLTEIEPMDLPRFSLKGVYTNETDIMILYENEDKTRNSYQLKAKIINPKTFKQKTEKKILEFENRKKNSEDVFINRSKNKNYFSIFFSSVQEKSNKMNITAYLYDDQFDELWSSPYITQREEQISPTYSITSNHGYIYILSAVLPQKKTDKKEETVGSLVLARIGENSTDEFLIEGDFYQQDLILHELSEDEVFIASSNKKNLLAVTYKLSQEKVINTVKFAYQYPENKKAEMWWNLANILSFDNGNLAVVIKDNYKTHYYGGKSPDYDVYTDRNFTVLTIDPLRAEKPIYNTTISRAVSATTFYPVSSLLYERPLFFTKGNDFYAIYNADNRDNDLSGTVFTESNLELYNLKRVITDILHISENGKATVTGLFSYNDHDVVFSSGLTHLRTDGKLQIGSIVKKALVFGDLNINELK